MKHWKPKIGDKVFYPRVDWHNEKFYVTSLFCMTGFRPKRPEFLFGFYKTRLEAQAVIRKIKQVVKEVQK